MECKSDLDSNYVKKLRDKYYLRVTNFERK